MFILFRILGGLGIGAASMTSPMYIAEITPARIRGRMVSVNQFAIVSGILVVYFVNYFIALQGERSVEPAARLAVDVRLRGAAGPGAAGPVCSSSPKARAG